MVSLDEQALTCDFAETYHVLDWRALPPRQAAALAMGLRPDSRIMMKINGAAAPLNTLLLALIADAERILVWQNTEDGVNGRRRPSSLLAVLTHGEEKEAPGEGFDTPEEFETWHDSMTGGGQKCRI